MASAASSLDALSGTISDYFAEPQHSIANHRKNAVGLHRIHTQCAQITEETPKGTKLIGEKSFNSAFLDCLNRVLHIKKGVVQADRTLKFVATYAAYAQTQFRAAARKVAGLAPDHQVDADEEEEDTTATRFVNILIKHALKGFAAKNKNVRLRCCQTVALLIHGLESMDDDLYQILLSALLIRIRDKESAVRVQAIVALAKLQSGEEQDDEQDKAKSPDHSLDDDDDETMTEVYGRNIRRRLLEVLRTDPSPEVRRAALFNLPVAPSTLPFLLERLRDVDAVNRRCVYLATLNTALASQSASLQLSTEETHHIVKTGLGEREETVKKACAKLLGAWADREQGDSLKFVDRFDGLTHPESTMSALKSVFETRPQVVDSVTFDDDFWNNLTPNSALLARSLVEHLKAKGQVGEARLEELMPVVMALAFRIQGVWTALAETIATADEQAEEESDEVDEELRSLAMAQASILESLLHIALNSDYGDEIGRRKMFTMIREMISHSGLPQSLIEPCIDVLLKLSAGQRDFVRIVVEIVQELADEDEDEEMEDAEESEGEEAEVEDLIEGRDSPSKPRRRGKDGTLLSAEEEEARAERKYQLEGRRLHLVRAMLERMASNLHENTAIHGLIPQLIAPAVRSKDAEIREQGLFCLGLCCLLDSKLALDTFPLFLDQIQNAEGDIKLRAAQVAFDCLLVHGIPYLSSRQARAAGGGAEAEAVAHSQIVGFLLGLLEDDEARVQAVAAEGMAKLMLSGMVRDGEALRSLVLVYMSPETIGNQEMRQCLSYFLPVYCFSSSTNQRRLQRVLVSILQVLTEVYNEVTSGADGGDGVAPSDMVTPLQVGLQLIEWTDASKAVNLAEEDHCIHFDVALELLQELLTAEEKDERKVTVQLLNKLNMPEAASVDSSRGKTLFLLCAKVKEVAPFDETSSRNAFNKFETACAKKYADHATSAKACNGDEKDEDLQKLRGFLESLGLDLLADDELIAVPPAESSGPGAKRGSVAAANLRKSSAASSVSGRSVSGTTRRSVSGTPVAGARKVSGGGSRRGTARNSRASVAPSDAADDTIRELDGEEDEDLVTTLGDLTTDDDDELAA